MLPNLEQQIDEFLAQGASSSTPEQREARLAQRTRLIQQMNVSNRLQVGTRVPAFALPDANGQPVTLDGLLANGPLVIAFYRGDWCPFCNLTLRAYQAALPEFQKFGATLVAISPQTADKSLLTATNKQLTYPVLSDVGNVVARQFGLVWTIPEAMRATSVNLPEYNGDDSWELPVPGTFVIGQDQRVAWESVNADWTQRTEPSAIVAALAALVPTQ